MPAPITATQAFEEWESMYTVELFGYEAKGLVEISG